MSDVERDVPRILQWNPPTFFRLEYQTPPPGEQVIQAIPTSPTGDCGDLRQADWNSQKRHLSLKDQRALAPAPLEGLARYVEFVHVSTARRAAFGCSHVQRPACRSPA
eukprot:2022610-Prymnesium_polylepis.1